MEVPLENCGSVYDPTTLWWTVSVCVPEVPLYELYDLVLSAAGVVEDATRHAVRVIPEFKQDYYFVQITDTHLPTHRFYYESGADTDTSEVLDLRAVINDINLINPEFVLITGDFINEGELEDYQSRRYYTRSQRLLTEFEVPVFLIAGNHDIGGWRSTPPPAGTARRDWWRFFGWKRLDVPPAGAPWHTQNYSFDYGPVHFIGLEAYDNYDSWRYGIYGADSFTSGQMQWLNEDLAASASSVARVLFYHYDFSHEINLNSLGVEMALWGHIHSDDGSIAGPPHNLATDNVCDGARSYRVVRVSDGVLTPLATISAGSSGQKIIVEYDPANDGTNDTVTARITNYQSVRFEHSQLRFLMPNRCDDPEVEVTGGTLLQIDDSGPIVKVYVGVDIDPFTTNQIVSVTLDSTCTGGGDPSTPEVVWLGRSSPNPFTPATLLRFGLNKPGTVRLEVFDIKGRRVSQLVDDHLPAGEHRARWTGLDDQARPAAPGVYFARLTTAGTVLTRKIILVR
ncbi:MAG: metallophosphoesterase [Candidatus Eisenbacteria bacterium]